jgi:hypothetical protein
MKKTNLIILITTIALVIAAGSVATYFIIKDNDQVDVDTSAFPSNYIYPNEMADLTSSQQLITAEQYGLTRGLMNGVNGVHLGRGGVDDLGYYRPNLEFEVGRYYTIGILSSSSSELSGGPGFSIRFNNFSFSVDTNSGLPTASYYYDYVADSGLALHVEIVYLCFKIKSTNNPYYSSATIDYLTAYPASGARSYLYFFNESIDRPAFLNINAPISSDDYINQYYFNSDFVESLEFPYETLYVSPYGTYDYYFPEINYEI